MIVYWRFFGLAECCIEFDKKMGKTPLFTINTCKKEMIIDIPYGQVIFSPIQTKLQQKTQPMNDVQQTRQRLRALQHKNALIKDAKGYGATLLKKQESKKKPQQSGWDGDQPKDDRHVSSSDA